MENEEESGDSTTFVSQPPGPEGPKFPVYGMSSSELESDTTEDDITLSEDTTDVFAITVTDLGSESDFGHAIENYRRRRLLENVSNNQGDITSGLSDQTDSESALSLDSSDQKSSRPGSFINAGNRQHAAGHGVKTSRGAGRGQAQEDSVPWYFRKEFEHYWRHYQATLNWCQQHRRVSQTLQVKYDRCPQPRGQVLLRPPLPPVYPWYPSPGATANLGSRYPGHHPHTAGSRQQRRHQRRRNRSRSRHSSSTSTTGTATGSEMSTEKSSSMIEEGSNCESEEYEMHISEELMAFYAEAEKFRQERDAAKKKAEKSQEEKYIDMEDVEDSKRPTVEAPKQRPGALRTSQMRSLYGHGAAMIHGMETALQMNFDRNLDIHQPSHWPNIPYRLIFN